MNKLLNNITSNKNFKRWLGIILAIALVATMFPYMSAAYGNNDEPAPQDEPVLVEPGDNTIISEEGVEEEVPEQEEMTDPQPSDNGIAVVAEGQTEADTNQVVERGVSNTITWDSNNAATINEGDTVNLLQALTLPKAGTYTLTVNGTLNGVIKVGANRTLKLEGTGTIDGAGWNASVVTVKGRDSVLNLNMDPAKRGSNGLTITGGTGTKLPTDFGGDSNTGLALEAGSTAGGGIHVQRTVVSDQDKTESYYQHNPKFIMYGGTITGNSAQSGGGIYVDRWCNFEMYGGTVSSNTATKHEGGGIYTAAPDGEISAGTISENTTKTTTDWGGGGLFIESRGKVALSTVKVWNNTAYGLGGGISGCPHAKIGIGNITQGAAIYGNTANKNGGFDEKGNKVGGKPKNEYLEALHVVNGENIAYKSKLSGKKLKDDLKAKEVSGDIYAYDTRLYENKFKAELAKDYYCTRSSLIYGQELAQNIEGISWKGIYAGPDKSELISIANGKWYTEGQYSVGLTATAPSGAGITRNVTIEGNKSYTHGGGIGCNGNLVIGPMPDRTIYNPWNIEFDKVLQKVDGAGNINDVPQFEFGLYTDPSGSEEFLVATATNDSQGKIEFTVDDERFRSSGTYTFYVKEIESDKNIEFDKALRTVKVKIVQNSKTAELNGVNVTTITPEATITSCTPNATFTNRVTPKDHEDKYIGDWKLEFTKQFLDGRQYNVFKKDDAKKPEFNFALYGSKKEIVDGEEKDVPDLDKLLATKKNDSDGNIVFNFVESPKENKIQLGNNDGKIDVDAYRKITEDTTYTFFAKEVLPEANEANPSIVYDEVWRKVVVPVKVSSSISYTGTDLEPTKVTTYASKVDSGEIRYYTADNDGNFATTPDSDGNVFKNECHPKGTLNLQGVKNFYGAETDGFTFTMKRVNVLENGKVDSTNIDSNDVYTGKTGNFVNGVAPITFDRELTYQVPEDYQDNDYKWDYWYMITENASDGVVNDPRVYVLKVSVVMADDGLSLSSSVAELYYAEGIKTDQDGNQLPLDFSDLSPLDIEQNGESGTITLPELEFSNFDEQMATMSAFGYAVNAASNAPVDQKCFVDPKIIKNLEGRSLAEGEFNFKLIEINADKNGVVDWSQTQGVVISETSNDRYGMVDFDKANNLSGSWENPSCLLYTAPGTYYYRVVEANDLTDPSVDYSKQIITFTTVIEFNEDGQLECTDMYYGHVENGENVRYTESENPQWHPTMTNYARGMDLQVRKTSALDRENGLEGATYGLYAVNNGAQADIFLGEGTSNEDGWITFKNVSLNEGTLYYFKERLAPAGHTVSEFRSSYFYIVKDPSAPNGYTMMYTDSKADLGSKADAGDIVALAEAQDGQDGTQGGTPQGAQSEDGNMLFTFEQDGGVFDEATYTEIAKVDTRTHEWVEGAELSIVEKDSGKVINSWKSGTAVEVLQGKLNVDTTYILREDKAPEGYAKANDVEFKIDQYGAIEILSGTSNGNAELQDATIRLYDTMLDAEVVETVPKENVIETPDNSAGGLSKTGDYLPIAGVALLALGSLIVLLVIARKKRNSKEQ